jgi:hypothetical protein
VSRFLAIAALCLSGCLSPVARAAEVDMHVDQVIQAYGGSAALALVKAYRMEGTIESRLQGAGPMLRTFARPDRLRVELRYPDRPEVRVVDGGRGWRSDAFGKLAPVDGFLLASMFAQVGRANLPWLLDEQRRQATLVAGGDPTLQGINVTLGAGIHVTAWIERATGRIVRSTSHLDVPGMRTSFVTEYSDFRTVDGVLFAFRETSVASGQPTGQTRITRVTINPDLGPDAFGP